MSDKTAADAPSRAHDDLADAIIERVLNLDEYSSPDDDPDVLLVKRRKLHFIASEEAAAALSAKDARIADLETMLGELVRSFNPEPALPALTLWDRAAAVLGNVPTQSPSEIRAESEIARLREALPEMYDALHRAAATVQMFINEHSDPGTDAFCCVSEANRILLKHSAALRQEPGKQ